MGRPRKTVPPIRFGCCLPSDLNNRMEKHLFSEVEARIPHGAKSNFIEGLVRDYFTKLDGDVNAIQQSLEGL